MSSTTKNVVCFALGTLFGTLGIKALTSQDAKKAYVHVTAAGLRAKDSIMESITTVQENVGDIIADAKDLNEARAAEAEAEEEDFEAEEETEAAEEPAEA